MPDLKTINIPHLGGGIRNDVVSELIDPSQAWDSLNEDSSLNLGTASKRKGALNIGSLGYPIRCIWEGKAWEKRRIVVAGGKIYKFTPPSTFTEIYDGFDGDKHDYVNVATFMDDAYGGIFVLMDGVNRPLWWDGIGAPEQLPEACPIAKCGTAFRSYFILGNLTVPSSMVYDSGDQAIGNIAQDNYSAVTELDVEWVSGTIVGIVTETSTDSPDFDVHIFDTPPLGWNTNTTSNQYPMNSPHHIFSQSNITDKGWRDMNLAVDFYTTDRKLYIGVFNDKAGADNNIKIRILYKTTFQNSPYKIQWCPPRNIREWREYDDDAVLTGSGWLLLDTREAGAIVKLLPFSRDVLMAYKDDGSVVAITATGSSAAPFTFNTISEGLEIPSGDAIVPWGDSHWILSTEGFLKVGTSGVEMVEPYGKAKKIFESRNKYWKNCHGTILEHERKALISYPRSGDEDKDGVIAYNLKAGLYDKWDCAYNVIGSCTSDEANTIDNFAGMKINDFAGMTINDLQLKPALPEFYAGDYDGNIYRLGWVYRDDESAINTWRESGWIRPDEEGKCWYRYIELLLDVHGSSTLSLEVRTNYDSTWTTLPSISLASSTKVVKTVTRYMNRIGESIKLRWSNSTIYESYTIRGITIGYEPVGRV